jgi:hypothetical protein
VLHRHIPREKVIDLFARAIGDRRLRFSLFASGDDNRPDDQRAFLRKCS